MLLRAYRCRPTRTGAPGGGVLGSKPMHTRGNKELAVREYEVKKTTKRPRHYVLYP